MVERQVTEPPDDGRTSERHRSVRSNDFRYEEAPFREVLTIDDPTRYELEAARARYPEAIVGDTGPIPDPRYRHDVSLSVRVPDWLVATVVDQLSDIDDPTEEDLRRVVFNYLEIESLFVAADGESLADIALE